jgi:hypothetical protein
MLIHKYYYILYIWSSSSFRSIFLNRIYGMIIAIFVFTPILSYIYMLLNYSILNIYILIVIVSIIDDNYLTLRNYKFIKYVLLIINLLKINKDIILILRYRNIVSLFSILIKKSLNQINNNKSIINKYAFIINEIYKESNSHETIISKKIIDYYINLKNIKLMIMKNSLIQNYNTLFEFYSLDIFSNLDDSLCRIGNIIYYKLQNHYKFNNNDLIKLNKLEQITYLLIKLILFYY